MLLPNIEIILLLKFYFGYSILQGHGFTIQLQGSVLDNYHPINLVIWIEEK